MSRTISLKLEFKKTKTVQSYGIDNEAKVKCITYLLIKWIICNQQPFMVVEDPSFVEFIKELDEYHPTLEDLHLIFTTINRSFDEIIYNTSEETTTKLVTTVMAIKFDEYWQKLDQSSFIIASLNPNVKLSLYNTEKQYKAQEYMKNLYSKYNTSNTSSSSKMNTVQLTSRDYFKKAFKHSFNSPGVASELQNYLKLAEVDCE
ncbi:12872_t:CDS:2, partial [Dentiscutata erythropus]